MAIGIVGGGALGLAAALTLVEAGREVVVLERDTTLGGLAAGFKLGPSYLERFYHHLFGTDTTVLELIRHLGLGERLVWKRPDQSVLSGGRIYSLDSAVDVLRFGALPLPDRVRLGAVLAYLKLERRYQQLDRWTAAEWLARWNGQATYRVLWEPLLRAKFGVHFDRIAMPWIWARIHCRTQALGYLRGGFQALYERLGETIVARGGRVELGKEVSGIAVEPDGAVLVTTTSGDYRFERLLATLPTRLFLRLARGLPREYVDRYAAEGEHFGAHCLVLALERPLLQDVYWLGVNDPGFPFLSIIEHTNYMPPQDYGGRHVVYLGNYLPMDHELFRMDERQVLEAFLPHLARVTPAFKPGWVREAYVFKGPYAQPIVTRGYADRLPPHQTPLPGVLLANMGHVYPQDRGQNYSVALGQRMAKLVLQSTVDS
ncbi:MAG: NAD(P)/FAD-dependent oxidoreductase [Chloroflexi bacterium]|nr:NAD(P)/FAD-dependent oxidoreductase [Chloroflexota bacterium]